MATKKNRLFHFFNYNRDNRPDALEEDTTPTLKRYFKVLGRRFWKLISLNLMMLPLILPILIAVYLFLCIPQVPTAEEVIFPQIYAAGQLSPTPESAFLFDLFGGQIQKTVIDGTSVLGYYIGIGACILFLILTFGWQNVGATYVLRNMVKGEPVFIWSDYFYAVKRNLRQGLLLGLLDFLAIFALGFDIFLFWNPTGEFWGDFFFFASAALAILYLLMRFYIYLLLVTFELSIRKILKNALIFSMLGIKRNFMAILGIVVITGIAIALFPLFAITPLGIAIPLILPLLYYLAITAFTSAYAAYPIIDRYMIAPYVTDDDEEAVEETEETGADEAADAE